MSVASGQGLRGGMSRGRRVLRVTIQVALALAVAWVGYELVTNAAESLRRQGIATGFEFLDTTAGFAISQSLIPYSEADSYRRAFVVGLLNTLLIAAVAIVLSTLLGFVVGIARLSSNWLVEQIARAYVEIVRNLPLLFQILFWYLAVLSALPGPRQSFSIGWGPFLDQAGRFLAALPATARVGDIVMEFAASIGPPAVHLNNRGLFIPRPYFDDGTTALVTVAACLLLVIALAAVAGAKTRTRSAPGMWVIGVFGVCLAIALLFIRPMSLVVPELRGFNFVGGWRVSPEFIALLLGLSIYTAGFIAEIVRAGVLAVGQGQREAASALALPRGAVLRLVVIPQALRLIIPPLTSQYVNVVKNSSLAIVIGFPDLVAVFAGTTLIQTGQAIEIIAVTMTVYLVISLLMSGAMNYYNSRLARWGASR